MLGQKALGLSISSLGLWSTLSAVSLAQSIDPAVGSASQSAHPPLAHPAMPAGANIGQIVLPPPEDVPEEILRTEIIFEARSPLDGTPLSPADYAQLQADLADAQTIRPLNPDISFILFLLQTRRAFKPVIPFLP